MPNCLYCSSSFIKESNAQKFCTKKCQNNYQQHKHKTSRLEYQREWRTTKRGYASRFLERARAKTKDSDLTLEYILSIFDDRYPICKKEFVYKNEFDCFHNPFAPSIDRIDSNVGYYKGNVQIILVGINRMKNDMPNDDFLLLWKALME